MVNVLTAVIPQILAQGVMALRQQAIMPRLVNRKYEREAGLQGSTIDVPIPSAIATTTVVPGATPPATPDLTPTSVAIPLSEWKEAPFHLSDKEQLEILEGPGGYVNMQVSEAIKSLANNVDNFLLALTTKFYGYRNPAGIGNTPRTAFTDSSGNPTNTQDATRLRAILNNQLAPMDDRHQVMSADMEAAALDLRAFQDASYSGSVQAILEGQLNRKIGAQWWMDQNVATHTPGTFSDLIIDGTAVLGEKTVTVDSVIGGTAVVGDIVTFAGHTQTYVVTTLLTLAATASGELLIEPGLVAVPADSAAVTLEAAHVNNPFFHRDAIAFATRPLIPVTHPSIITRATADPISGLTLRLTITAEHRRVRFAFDILYGGEVVRRELGARMAG